MADVLICYYEALLEAPLKISRQRAFLSVAAEHPQGFTHNAIAGQSGGLEGEKYVPMPSMTEEKLSWQLKMPNNSIIKRLKTVSFFLRSFFN